MFENACSVTAESDSETKLSCLKKKIDGVFGIVIVIIVDIVIVLLALLLYYLKDVIYIIL